MDRTEFLHRLESEPILNVHSHHLRDQHHHALNLEKLMRSSYVDWCGVPMPSFDAEEEVSIWLDAVRTRSFFIWLEKALMKLYQIDEPLSLGNIGVYDAAIRKAHQDKDWHLEILQEECRYEAIILDTFWAPGEDNGNRELFKPAYRINSLFYGYNHTAKDHNGHNIQVTYNRSITDIDEYIDFIEAVLLEQKQAGCVVLKCALAYDRALDFEEATKAEAQRAMGRDADEQDIILFQDYIFDQVCRIAAELDLPLQIHTGLGLMNRTNAMQLQPMIAKHPDTTFLLMHGSYPWTSDTAGLAHAYPNVWADLCWLPLISPTAAKRLLHELIDVCDANRVVWGCDTWTSEESYGARLAFLHVLDDVLSERVAAGLMRWEDALRYAQGVLYHNGARLLKK